MGTLLLFAFLSGLVTIFAPCIWPLLPVVLSSSATGGKRKPAGVTLGILTSFGLLILSISYLVKIIPLDPNALRVIAVLVIGFLGLSLLVPKLTKTLEASVSKLSSLFGKRLNLKDQEGFKGGYLVGLALGVVWTPCAGPILATIATLAATRSVNLELVLVTLVYIVGIGIPLFIFAAAGQRIFAKSRFFSKYTGRVQQVFGLIMIIMAVLIFTNYDKVLQAKLLDAIPSYSNFLYKLEGNKNVSQELKDLKNKKSEQKLNLFNTQLPLDDLGQAPEFSGISRWLNTEKPLTMAQLKGKVVLIDFWTYTCINCIRTLPYVKSWWQKYQNQGLVVVGVHTPEFEFEKKTENVLDAIKMYGITYPVAQDNDYETWKAYDNHYWPAKYLIDATGRIRYTHFGEGEYEKTEEVIQALLKEKGETVSTELLNIVEETPTGLQTPETYLGKTRMERIVSEEEVKGGTQTFTKPSSFPVHYFAYSGTWNIQNEFAQSVKDSQLEIHFYASKVFLVITPKTNQDEVLVFLDGKKIDPSISGKDVKSGQIILDIPRLYDLVNLSQKEDHVLLLKFQNEGSKIFAFTFG